MIKNSTQLPVVESKQQEAIGNKKSYQKPILSALGKVEKVTTALGSGTTAFNLGS